MLVEKEALGTHGKTSKESQMWILRSKSHKTQGRTYSKVNRIQVDLGRKLTVPPTKIVGKNTEFDFKSKSENHESVSEASSDIGYKMDVSGSGLQNLIL